MCIYRQVITALKTAIRKKHGPLNYAELFFRPAYSDSDKPEEKTLLDLLENLSNKNPEIQFFENERKNDLIKSLHGEDGILTDLEFQALFAKLVLGKRYEQIAQELQKKHKTIDNAIQRAKKKIRKVFALEDFEI